MFGAEVGSFDVEFGNGIDIRNCDATFVHARIRVQSIDLVLGHIVPGSEALNSEGPFALNAVLSEVAHARNEPDQLNRISSIERQVHDLLLLDNRFHRTLLGLNQLGLSFNRDLLGNFPHLQFRR